MEDIEELLPPKVLKPKLIGLTKHRKTYFGLSEISVKGAPDKVQIKLPVSGKWTIYERVHKDVYLKKGTFKVRSPGVKQISAKPYVSFIWRAELKPPKIQQIEAGGKLSTQPRKVRKVKYKQFTSDEAFIKYLKEQHIGFQKTRARFQKQKIAVKEAAALKKMEGKGKPKKVRKLKIKKGMSKDELINLLPKNIGRDAASIDKFLKDFSLDIGISRKYGAYYWVPRAEYKAKIKVAKAKKYKKVKSKLRAKPRSAWGKSISFARRGGKIKMKIR